MGGASGTTPNLRTATGTQRRALLPSEAEFLHPCCSFRIRAGGRDESAGACSLRCASSKKKWDITGHGPQSRRTHGAVNECRSRPLLPTEQAMVVCHHAVVPPGCGGPRPVIQLLMELLPEQFPSATGGTLRRCLLRSSQPQAA